MAVDLQQSPQHISVISSDNDTSQVAKSLEEESRDKTGQRQVKFSEGSDSLGDVPSPTQPQPSLMAPVKPISLRIFTVDNQSELISFPTGRYTTAGDIVSAMITQLRIPTEMKDVFSIWLLSPYLQLQLKSYHVPVKLFKKWHELLTQYTTASYDVCKSDQPLLSFRRNAFLPLKEEKRLIAKRNSKEALTLLYHEAVFNVVNGRYPLSKEELIELGSLQCAVENKEFDEQKHTPDYFKPNLKQYFPTHLIPVTTGLKSKLLGGGSKTDGLENDLVTGYKDAWDKVSKGTQRRMEKEVNVEESAVARSLGQDEEVKMWQDTDLQLKLLYLQRCWIKPYYGCVMFRGQVERKASNIKQLLVYSDRNVIIAINTECLHLFTDNSPRDIMLYLTYDLFSWDFHPATEEGENFYSSLWLEFDSMQGSHKVAKRLQIFSRQAPMMDAMITRCVDELNKQDEELKKLRINEGGPEELPLCSIKTDRNLPLAKNYKEDKFKCDVYTPDGEPVSQFKFFKKKSIDDITPPPVGPSNPLIQTSEEESSKLPHPQTSQ